MNTLHTYTGYAFHRVHVAASNVDWARGMNHKRAVWRAVVVDRFCTDFDDLRRLHLELFRHWNDDSFWVNDYNASRQVVIDHHF